ncbi:hypothetical protein [Xenorhabdus cabanillasii]|uniref:Uncharacterized protein n=1 Tax=Xenorhabdus cabanillasii JM26 TaxID=1427517 RepID=W1IPC9_9GAMM|nr:hypothetical protein [Xenorhabdus cabanillasii]PHM78144.1 hypothetical protein Xcab_01194 [Xenorhabdus cabanillasii JM26]CDL79451.1 conserved hypothetical protein [Xenorhabdus cabanillasii JM26]
MAAPNNKMTMSKINPDDLVIGQHVNFTVTLSSDNTILKGKKITINNNHSKNIQFDADSVDLTNEPGDLTATAKLGFKILPGTQDGESITFEVETNATADGVVFKSISFSDKAKAASKNVMEISINKKADLVIGQYVSFIVTLSSDVPIYPGSVNIKNHSNNIQFDLTTAALSYLAGAKKATAMLGFTVLPNTQDDSDITFEVEADVTTIDQATFQPVKFTGKANEIDINSLALFIEQPYLQVPLNTGAPKPQFTPIYTTLKNKNTHKKLVGTPIFITSQQKNKMEEFDFKDASNTNLLSLEKVGPAGKGLMLTSDKDGLVKFYLYPRISLVSILKLLTLILTNDANGAMALAKNTIYAVNYSDPGYLNSIGIPSIVGKDPTNLVANSSESGFLTIINSYPAASMGDIILFFVNNYYTGHSVTIEDPAKQLDNYVELPCSIFTQGKTSDFSYAAIKPNGDALYSIPLPVTYLGGVPYEPVSNVKRDYELCRVHTSLGVGPDNIIPPDNDISYSNIMLYPGYKYKGLFIEILRSDTINQKAKTNPVPLSISDITLNMYVNSDNKSFTLSYTTPISLANIGGSGDKDSIFFHIPYTDIVGVQWKGNISFDYQFFKDETKKYSAIWNGFIGTVPTTGDN